MYWRWGDCCCSCILAKLEAASFNEDGQLTEKWLTTGDWERVEGGALQATLRATDAPATAIYNHDVSPEKYAGLHLITNCYQYGEFDILFFGYRVHVVSQRSGNITLDYSVFGPNGQLGDSWQWSFEPGYGGIDIPYGVLVCLWRPEDGDDNEDNDEENTSRIINIGTGYRMKSVAKIDVAELRGKVGVKSYGTDLQINQFELWKANEKNEDGSDKCEHCGPTCPDCKDSLSTSKLYLQIEGIEAKPYSVVVECTCGKAYLYSVGSVWYCWDGTWVDSENTKLSGCECNNIPEDGAEHYGWTDLPYCASPCQEQYDALPTCEWATLGMKAELTCDNACLCEDCSSHNGTHEIAVSCMNGIYEGPCDTMRLKTAGRDGDYLLQLEGEGYLWEYNFGPETPDCTDLDVVLTLIHDTGMGAANKCDWKNATIRVFTPNNAA